jgi:hypothetical protein
VFRKITAIYSDNHTIPEHTKCIVNNC